MKSQQDLAASLAHGHPLQKELTKATMLRFSGCYAILCIVVGLMIPNLSKQSRVAGCRWRHMKFGCVFNVQIDPNPPAPYPRKRL